MKIKGDTNNALGIPVDTYANPLDLAEGFCFKQKGHNLNYKERALNICLSSNVQFNSTANSLWDIAKKLLSCTCPYCNKNMDPNGGGGSSTEGSIDFRCACGATVTLTMPWDGINICPKNPVE